MTVVDLVKNEVKDLLKNDPAHDFQHVLRVYRNAEKICKEENVHTELVLCAALLHDLISYPKSDKRSKLSSIESAKKAKKILKKFAFLEDEIKIICDAIEDHSFSRNAIPKTIEGKILQDADRLDALGSIGLARVFATSGTLNRPFYHPDDPFCKTRNPDDSVWALDHFFQKLLKIGDLMNTKSAKNEARKRTIVMKSFLEQLKKEIQP